MTDALSELSRLGNAFVFGERPVSIPGDARPQWRIAVVLLMLHICGRGGKASLLKVHILNWAIRTPYSRDSFLKKLNGELHPMDVGVQFDPVLNRAVDLARGEGLIVREKAHQIELLPKGDEWVAEIIKDSECLKEEKVFLKLVGKRVTEKVVEQLTQPSSVW